MGAEYSQQPRNSGGRHVIYEACSTKKKGYGGERCFKCTGHGKLFVEYECHSCRCEDRGTWSNYVGHCSCNGYGRQTVFEVCDDCFGRGYL